MVRYSAVRPQPYSAPALTPESVSTSYKALLKRLHSRHLSQTHNLKNNTTAIVRNVTLGIKCTTLT